MGISGRLPRRRDALLVAAALFGALATYLISMLAAAALLWFFGRFDANGLAFCLAETIVLALPTAIGASAGRLLLQQQL